MAPRTRSNRAEKLVKERMLSRGIVLNSCGFPSLPNELLLEILSYFPSMPVPQVVWLKEKTHPYRQVTLMALSQTCRALRSFFLQLAWERIEVFGGMWTPAGRLVTEEEQRYRGQDTRNRLDKKFAEETLRQLETVTVRNPELGQYVRIVNVMLVNVCHQHVLLPELAQGLSLLPHVHTLQIGNTTGVPKNYFSKYSYPKIHNLCLHGRSVYDVLHACPNLRSFILHNKAIIFPLKQVLQACATRIEVLGVLSTDSQLAPLLGDVVTGFPHLRDISVDFYLLRTNQDDLSNLASLPLHTVRLYLAGWKPHRFNSPFSLPTVAERTSWIMLAKKILKMCPTHGTDVQKRVMVINNDKSVDTHPVFA